MDSLRKWLNKPKVSGQQILLALIGQHFYGHSRAKSGTQAAPIGFPLSRSGPFCRLCRRLRVVWELAPCGWRSLINNDEGGDKEPTQVTLLRMEMWIAFDFPRRSSRWRDSVIGHRVNPPASDVDCRDERWVENRGHIMKISRESFHSSKFFARGKLRSRSYN